MELPERVPPEIVREPIVSETLVRLSVPPLTVTFPLARALALLATKVPLVTKVPPV